MKASVEVGHRAYQPGAKDAHGNAVDAWAARVPLLVYGIAPRGSQEPSPDRLEVMSGLGLYAPPETAVGPHDRFVIDPAISPSWAGEWKVTGEIADYNHGPFGFRPGVVITLSRVSG